MKLLDSINRKAKQSKFIQNLVDKPFDINSFPQTGTFTDSNNQEHILYDKLRDTIKPGASGANAKQLPYDKSIATHKLSLAEYDY